MDDSSATNHSSRCMKFIVLSQRKFTKLIFAKVHVVHKGSIIR